MLTVLTAVVLTGVGACGLPDGETRYIPPDDVPFRLLESDGPAIVPEVDRRPASGPRVYWVTSRDRLAPTHPQVSRPVEVDDLISRLVDGPAAQQLAGGLTSALGSDSRLDVVDLDDGIAVVSLDFGSQEPSSERLPLAIGQIVLTAVSAEGVDRVQIVSDGVPIDAPLPSGVLSSGPLSHRDYASLVVGSSNGR